MNKKISVLDLVNMKEDEMPRKIKYRDGIYDYQRNEKKYKKEDSEAEVWLDWKTEVEILEDNTEEIEEKSNFENMGYEIAQAYFEFYKGIAKALTEKRKESEDKQ